jgi:hypothetical protein
MANVDLSPNVGVEDGDQHDVLHHQPLRGQHVLHHALKTKQFNFMLTKHQFCTEYQHIGTYLKLNKITLKVQKHIGKI